MRLIHLFQNSLIVAVIAMILMPEWTTVWTVHKSSFDISLPSTQYDHKLGWYWRAAESESSIPAYRTVIPALLEHYQSEAILWCSSSLIGWQRIPSMDDIAWELTLPTSSILDHFNTEKWGQIVAGKEKLDLSKVSLRRVYPINRKCTVLVRWPLPQTCKITKLGSIKGSGAITEDFIRQLRGNQLEQ